MKIEARGLIYDATGRPASERIAFFTSLCPLRSGVMLAGFQVGPSKHAPTATIRLCRSRGGAVTWSEIPWRFETKLAGVPGSLAAGELVEVEPGRLLLFATWFDRSDPNRPLFDPVTEGVLHSKQLMAVSKDDGETWSPWEIVRTPGLTGCATTGPVVKWADGAIGHAFESFKEYDDPRPGRHAAWILLSRDGGRSFAAPLLVAQHPEHRLYYWDQRLCPTRNNGEFIAFFWTHDLEQKKDLTVHMRRAAIDGTDVHGGAITDTGIPGQIAAPLLLDDGRLLAFAVYRGRPGTMKLWVSKDGGKTWPETDALTVHTHDERAALSQGLEDIDFKQYWEDMGKWSFGHPAIRPLGDGRILLAWYAGTPDCMSVHWARIRV
ncbi:MAG TPA: sialidase family protein [Gemmataceae bacterium]|nr:sialidase family protein [Gemmataceae bacterium]